MKVYQIRLCIAWGIIYVVFLNTQRFVGRQPVITTDTSTALIPTSTPLIPTSTPLIQTNMAVIDTTSARIDPRACAPGYAQLPTDWGAITKDLTQRAAPRKIIHFTVFDCEVRPLWVYDHLILARTSWAHRSGC